MVIGIPIKYEIEIYVERFGDGRFAGNSPFKNRSFSTYMILRYNLTHAKIDEVLWDVELREPELWQAWLEEQL